MRLRNASDGFADRRSVAGVSFWVADQFVTGGLDVMKTDKQLYAIFSVQPEWVFELSGLKSPGRCTLQAVTLKELEQQSDSVIVPDDSSQPITIAEFQFQLDKRIYNRTAVEMSLVQDLYDGREVQGLIFFRSANLDPQTKPWNRIIQSFTFDAMLESLQQRSPEHPLVAVFQPLMARDEQVLEAHAREYYHQIRSSALDPICKETLSRVFVSWLQQRFTSRKLKEIEMLFVDDLPDLKDTASGKELIEIGRQEGARVVLISMLEAKFGAVPPEVLRRIEALESFEELAALMRQLVTIDSIDQLQWS